MDVEFVDEADIDSKPDIEGYILNIEDDEILVAQNISSEEFEDIEDRFVSKDPSLDFDGPDDVDLIYIDYKDTNENIDKVKKAIKSRLGLAKVLENPIPDKLMEKGFL